MFYAFTLFKAVGNTTGLFQNFLDHTVRPSTFSQIELFLNLTAPNRFGSIQFGRVRFGSVRKKARSVKKSMGVFYI
jgi:hypothetical protein